MTLFYELLQVAIGQRECLSRMPTEEAWGMLYDMAELQTVAGVSFVALEKLSGKEQKPPQDLLFDYLSG